jgi:D-threo-aldose 1-dehydrogenase
MIDRANRIADICEAHAVTLPVAALAYPLLHPAVISVVIGARGAEQVDQNVERYSTPVSPDLWGELRAADLIPDLPLGIQQKVAP